MLALKVGSYMFVEDVISATLSQKVGKFMFIEDITAAMLALLICPDQLI